MAFLGSTSMCFTTLSSFPLAGPVFPFPAHTFVLRPHSSDIIRCRNINLLSIDYAFRPRLRSRLPQGRSALPWNPWIFGLGDSHPHLATHSGILPSWISTAPFGTASAFHQCSPTNDDSFLSFGGVFEPRSFSAQALSASELLRTL